MNNSSKNTYYSSEVDKLYLKKDNCIKLNSNNPINNLSNSNTKSISSNDCNNESDDEYKNLIDQSTTNGSQLNCTTYTIKNSSQYSYKPKAKKKSSLGMISDLNWSKRVGNFEVLRNQQILYKLIQKHASSSLQVNHKCMR